MLWLAHREATSDAFRAETYSDKSGTVVVSILQTDLNWEKLSLPYFPIAAMQKICGTTSKGLFALIFPCDSKFNENNLFLLLKITEPHLASGLSGQHGEAAVVFPG